MKIIPLIKAQIKGFFRNWRAILLLTVFPLFIVSAIFLSFNPDGMSPVKAGLINAENSFDLVLFRDATNSFLILEDYDNLDTCIENLKNYQEYACMEVEVGDAIIIHVYFDNTREPIIWEVIERIERTVNQMQKTQATQAARSAFGAFGQTISQVDLMIAELDEADKEIDNAIDTAELNVLQVKNSKRDMDSDLNTISSNIDDINDARTNFKSDTSSFNQANRWFVTSMDGYATELENAGDTTNVKYALRNFATNYENNQESFDNSMYDYNSITDTSTNSMIAAKNSIDSSSSGINRNLEKIEYSMNNLRFFQNNIQSIKLDLSSARTNLAELNNLDPETLVNPIVVKNKPTLVPETSGDSLNLSRLQTVFPSVLLLMVLFLSLLISSYLCLSEINGSANRRVRLIPHIDFPEIISLFISTLIILTPPFAIVLILGQFLFGISLLSNIIPVISLIGLTTCTLVLAGMTLSYIIKKESITLLLTTFILVLLIFFSGFLLPIERMSSVFATVANVLPGKLMISGFNMSVFYGLPISAYSNLILGLAVWTIFFMVTTIFARKFSSI